MGDSFYDRLPSAPDLRTALAQPNLADAPEDWALYVSDIADSTSAIAAGRYRDVNLLGAATIVVAGNAASGASLPFVFGGDGAAVLAPPELTPAIDAQLVALRALAAEGFQLDLRVGRFAVADLSAQGRRLEIGKCALFSGRDVAMFRGDGLAAAEDALKRGAGAIEAEPAAGGADLGGLSCRWRPTRSRRGRVLAILLQARDPLDFEAYDAFLAEVAGLFDGDPNGGGPVDVDVMRYKGFRESLRAERPMARGPAWRARRFEILMSMLIFRWRLLAKRFDADAYVAALPDHSDHRKFDGALRMILDCPPAAEAAIRAHLEAGRARGRLAYGVHASDHSLMTCYVDGLETGRHLHFIDGGDGGYARAAAELKAQLADA